LIYSNEVKEKERDRVYGCLFGLAVGDALGAPIEGLPREEVRARFGRVTDMMGGGWLKLAPGEVTDDTELALAIVRAIQKCGCVDPEEIAQAFIDWFKSDPKDIGGQTYGAIQALLAGVSPCEAGRRVWEESGGWLAGNGCLMRSAPIGLFLRRADFERRADASRKVAGITHGDPRCLDSVVLFDHAVAFLSVEGELHFEDVRRWASGMNPALLKRIEAIPRLEMEELSTGAFVLDTLESAFWFLFHADSFEEGLIDAVSLGQDADTTGAVTGALLGAKFGLSSIPSRWISKLTVLKEIENAAKFLFEKAER